LGGWGFEPRYERKEIGGGLKLCRILVGKEKDQRTKGGPKKRN